ncbi:hypothetical protein ABBQ38_005957 [Trebouxia sp. C0009 RCD-2024]
MAGPSVHGQKNKPHKAGRKAGLSARQKHKSTKEAGHGHRSSVKSLQGVAISSKHQRQQITKHHRDVQREQALAEKRSPQPPRVVALLPLSQEVDVPRLWTQLVRAGRVPALASEQGMDVDTGSDVPAMVPTLVKLPGQSRGMVQLLPPPADPTNPLTAVELARSAEVLLLVLPGGPKATQVDQAGLSSLAVLRLMGLPALQVLVQGQPHASLKDRSAAKKRAQAAVALQIAGEHKVMAADTDADCQQVLRHLGETHPSLPLWRRQRPALHLDSAEALFNTADASAQGTVAIRGYVRYLGLSVNQPMHIQGSGDFNTDRIEVAEPPGSSGRQPAAREVQSMDMAGSGARLLAVADLAARQGVVRLNTPDPLAGEQTWPTNEELMEAEARPSSEGSKRKRRLPKGMSDYQAAWITEEELGDLEESGSEGEEGDEEVHERQGGDAEPSFGDLAMDGTANTAELEEEDDQTDDMQDSEAAGDQTFAEFKRQRRAEQDDVEFPDEIDTPTDTPARDRFARYRGLKSWRSSPWDAREGLPQEYANTFAFENFKRAHKRARAAAEGVGGPQDPQGACPGSYVVVHLADVPATAALKLQQRVEASAQGLQPPLVAHGLLQHETKLSVLNFAVKKDANFSETLQNKAELLFVTGLRSFTARPVFSTDDPNVDKHKLERFLHDRRQCVATIYGPIQYPPLPLLAFKITPDHPPQLALAGTLRSCDPDRVVLKKIVLSGYPVKVHKKKAVVRWMFHNPEDVRWFKPLELWTKYGRRGRIKEPIGTHGAMKCMFDGVVQQRDAVCASLFKRSYPVWPANLDFCT